MNIGQGGPWGGVSNYINILICYCTIFPILEHCEYHPASQQRADGKTTKQFLLDCQPVCLENGYLWTLK